MAMLTNNVREWEPYWRTKLPIDEIFEVVVDSGFVGLRKPDPRIYELACEQLGVEAGEAMFVGDGANDELAGAERVGMRAVKLEGSGEAPDWRGTSIRELPELLELV